MQHAFSQYLKREKEIVRDNEFSPGTKEKEINSMTSDNKVFLSEEQKQKEENKFSNKLKKIPYIISVIPPRKNNLLIDIDKFIKNNFESFPDQKIVNEILIDYINFFPERRSIGRNNNLVYLNREDISKLHQIYMNDNAEGKKQKENNLKEEQFPKSREEKLMEISEFITGEKCTKIAEKHPREETYAGEEKNKENNAETKIPEKQNDMEPMVRLDSGEYIWEEEILRIIEHLNKNDFDIEDIYAYEPELRSKFQDSNGHVLLIKAMINQELNILCNKGYLEFREGRKYGITHPKEEIHVSTGNKTERLLEVEHDRPIVNLNEGERVVRYGYDNHSIYVADRREHIDLMLYDVRHPNEDMQRLIRSIEKEIAMDEGMVFPNTNNLSKSKEKVKKTFSPTDRDSDMSEREIALQENKNNKLDDTIVNLKDDVNEENKQRTQDKKTMTLRKTDQVVQSGNDCIWINRKHTVNCKETKVYHPDPIIQKLIDSIRDGTAYKIKENRGERKGEESTIKEKSIYLPNSFEKLDEENSMPYTEIKKDTGEQEIIKYDANLYYVREQGNCLELVDNKTGFPSLTLNKKHYILRPEKNSQRPVINNNLKNEDNKVVRRKFEVNSAKELIDILKSESERLGKTPTAAHFYNSPDLPSYSQYTTRWGSWNNAVKAAGLEPNVKNSINSGKDEFLSLSEKPQSQIRLSEMTPGERATTYRICIPGYKTVYYVEGQESDAAYEFLKINIDKIERVGLKDINKYNLSAELAEIVKREWSYRFNH